MIRSTAVLAALALALSACTAETPSPLTRDAASSFKDALLKSNEYVVASLTNPKGLTAQRVTTANRVSLPGPVAAILEASGVKPQAVDCVSGASPTAPVDVDGDKIPLTASYSVNCTVRDSTNGAGFKLTGAIALQDKADNDPKSGYVVDTSQYELSFYDDGGVNKGPVSQIALDLDVNLTRNNPNYSVAYNFFFSLGGGQGSASIRYAYTAGYAPQNIDNPFAAGTTTFDGAFTFRNSGPGNANPKLYQLTGRTTGLQHNAATCDRRTFVAGTSTFADTLGNSLSFTYSGCNNISVTYNGQAL